MLVTARGFRHPELPDTPDVPRDLGNLAADVETFTARPAVAVLTDAQVRDVGEVGQIRAGRQLAAADFTDLGLAIPAGLWNLGDLTDVSGNARALTNKGAVPFGVGVNGVAATAALFAGSGGQALYIADVGAADPFRIRTGSWGCWFRTAKRAQRQSLVSKWNTTAAQHGWMLDVDQTEVARAVVSIDGTADVTLSGVAVVTDDRWHFAVATFDATTLRLYVDGAQDASMLVAGMLAGSAAPLTIGGYNGSGTTGQPHYGHTDEAFVTPDVLSADQVRLLYAAKVAHASPVAPRRAALSVRRRRRGAVLAAADFPTAPRRLYNFTAASLADAGAQAVALTDPGGTASPLAVAGADGSAAGAYHFDGVNDFLSASDALLPTTGDRSLGAWFKSMRAAIQVIVTYGTDAGDSAFRMLLDASGRLTASTWTTNRALSAASYNDGQWHFGVITYQASPTDGVRFKLYVDGRLVESQAAGTTTTALAGATGFRVGASSSGTDFLQGAIDGAFLADYALAPETIRALYAKGAQDLGSSPKNVGDHVERVDASSVYLIGDTLEPQHHVDLEVAA